MMFQFAHIAPITLPLEDPILKFLLILIIILAAPLLLNKLKIPYLLGLIIAGAVIGPHGLNLVLRDSSIILSGTAGLLYIMFLSGLDNINRNILLADMPVYAAALDAGGDLVMSGFLEPDVPAITACAEKLGLRPVATAVKEGWVTVHVRKE